MTPAFVKDEATANAPEPAPLVTNWSALQKKVRFINDIETLRSRVSSTLTAISLVEYQMDTIQRRHAATMRFGTLITDIHKIEADVVDEADRLIIDTANLDVTVVKLSARLGGIECTGLPCALARLKVAVASLNSRFARIGVALAELEAKMETQGYADF